MSKKIDLSSSVYIEIITPNYYLEQGVLSVLEEITKSDYSLGTIANDRIMKVILIDIDTMPVEKIKWDLLLTKILNSDRVAFISFTKAKFRCIDMLMASEPVLVIKYDLIRLINNLITRCPLKKRDFFSDLNYLESNIVLFLTYGLSVKKIQTELQVNARDVYLTKSKIMRRYKLSNRKDLHVMLKLYGFINYLKYKNIDLV
ncbi:hypothetical protein N5863_29060 (plasmid) [Klebsiella pasteurii]|uniref:hypothetical protein n=1 Tax=Klebsiella pasteurii TaxID=2587529 RepID=UPI002543F085|nr:hypothetical protein [Klebsiella pasteurii]WII85145.1 hypothetical protein N5863_29060 [Klebsiella pasteurii]